MSLKLYYNPVSSYSQKALMALYEKGIPFEPAIVNLMDGQSLAQYKKLYPLGKIPLLRDESRDWTVPESSIIIEYLDLHYPGAIRLLPADPDLARQVRMRDRFFDQYVNDPMAKIFFDGMRPPGQGDVIGVQQARERLETALSMLDKELANRPFAAGDSLSMADCAAAPALGYCRMVHPFDGHKHVVAYTGRLLGRPSMQRVLQEAAPFLASFAKR